MIYFVSVRDYYARSGVKTFEIEDDNARVAATKGRELYAEEAGIPVDDALAIATRLEDYPPPEDEL